VWGKRKAVGRKHSTRFESINFEIEIGHEEAVRWERRAFFTRRQRRGRGKREFAPGKGSML
jgi:hypothetical protein